MKQHRGFKRYPIKVQDTLVEGRELLEKHYTFKRNQNSLRTLYIDDEGYFYVRRRKGIKARKLTGRNVYRKSYKSDVTFWGWLRQLGRRSLVVVLGFCFMLMLSANLIYVPQVKGSDMGIINPEAEINLSVNNQTEWELQKLTEEQEVVGAVKRIFKEHAGWAFKCMESENRGMNPNAMHWNSDKARSVDVGLLQVNAYWHRGKLGFDRMASECIEALKDIETNLKIAKQIFDTQGSKAWYGHTC